MDHSVDDGRGHEQGSGGAASQTGRDRQVAGRDIRHVKGALLLGGLPDQSVARAHHFAFGAGGQCISGEAPVVVAALRDVHGARLRVQVLGQEREHPVAQHGQLLLALDPLAQRHLAGAEPRLDRSRPVVAGHQHARSRNQADQDRRAAPGDARGEHDRVVPLHLARREQGALGVFHLANQHADLIHQPLAAVGSDDGEGTLSVPGAPQRNRLIELLRLFGGELHQRLDATLLLRVVDGQLAETPQLLGDRRPRVGVRREVTLLAGQEEAALAGFRVRDARQEGLELARHFERVRHPLDGGSRLSSER